MLSIVLLYMYVVYELIKGIIILAIHIVVALGIAAICEMSDNEDSKKGCSVLIIVFVILITLLFMLLY